MNGSASVHGKCILLGEHSVVRGQPALVFPLQSKRLTLDWQASPGQGIEIDGGDYSEAFRGALELALRHTAQELPTQKWNFIIRSEIPVRAGLGSSAALSVATVRFLAEIGRQTGDPFPLALEIENIFHGSSSGIDVAATLASSPILFQKGQKPSLMKMAWKPKLYLADSSLRSSTKACVEQVSALGRKDLDEEMGRLVKKAEAALAEANGLENLAKAMNSAGEIFGKWGLIPDQVEKQINELKTAGALGVKPTGSGNGGFVLSLWKSTPPSSLGLIPLSADS